MALTDPELDLLRELLDDDPTDEAFLQVGEELVRRGRWADAASILSAGLSAHPQETKGWSLLARAALECAHYDLALAALHKVDTDPVRSPQNAQLLILALERSGRTADAADRVEAYLQIDPDDVVVAAARERLEAPPPDARRRAADPFLTVTRAERYVAVGRVDRAVRVYRRILMHNPGDAALTARLAQLSAEGREWVTDDLSDELTDPGATPPELDMPLPRLTHLQELRATPGFADPVGARPHGFPASPEDESTDPGDLHDAVRAGRAAALPSDADADTDPDEEDTDLHALTPEGRVARTAQRARRRRRSLIQR